MYTISQHTAEDEDVYMLKYIYLNVKLKIMFITKDTCKIIEYSSDKWKR